MSEHWNHDTYLRRAHGLLARGLSPDLVHELRWAGNPSLIIEAERMTATEIVALNAAYRERHS